MTHQYLYDSLDNISPTFLSIHGMEERRSRILDNIANGYYNTPDKTEEV